MADRSKLDKPQMPEDLVALSPGQFAESQTRKQKKSGARNHPLKSWKVSVLGVVALIAVLMLDGLRREGAEYRARIVNTEGQVWVMPNGKPVSAYVSKGATVTNGDLVATGPDSTAVLAFPEGSTVLLEPNTNFKVRLIGYDRRGIRERSFMLTAGRIWSQVSESFGHNSSQMDVCTPTAVAAARGSVFLVGYDDKTRSTSVNVARGRVGFSSPGGRYEGDDPLEPGKAATAVGYRMGDRVAMTPEQLDEAVRYQRMLTVPAYLPKPSAVQTVERKVTDVVYVPLGWIAKSFDARLRQRTVTALQRIHKHMVSTQKKGRGEFPKFVNPLTFEELKMPEKERDQMLLSFAGNRIELYQKTRSRGYRLTVFAKDSQRTAYQISDKGTVENVTPREARTLIK